MLWKRAQQYSIRNPMSLKALFGMSLFGAFMICSVFGGVGAERIVINPIDPFNEKDMAHNRQVQADYSGTVFYVATDMFIAMSMG